MPARAGTAPGAGPEGLFVGLMSGTSADGIDAALVEFDAVGRCRLVHAAHAHWDPSVRGLLLDIGQQRIEPSLDLLGTLDVQVAEASRFLRAVKSSAPDCSAGGLQFSIAFT